MRYCVHYLEASQDRNGDERLLIGLDIGEFPADEDSQRDKQDQAAEDVPNDRKWM